MSNYNSGQGQGWPNQPYQPQGSAQWQPQRERMEPILLTAIIILAIIVPFIGPLVAIVVGAVNNRKIGGGALVGVGAVVILLDYFIPVMFIAAPNFEKIKLKAKEAETKQNLHSIQLSLERYATDNKALYPDSIAKLKSEGYLFTPPNTVTGKEMREVKFGEQPSIGEFTYVPVSVKGKTTGYYLLAYGFDDPLSEDVNGDGKHDNVILVLSSAVEGDKSIPPLEELLKK
jgi:hypothetical protein